MRRSTQANSKRKINMVFLSSMLSAFIIHTWYDTGMVYAIILAISAEVIYLSYTYKLIKRSEHNVREKYNKIINAYKEREILYEKQIMEHEKRIKHLRQKTLSNENVVSPSAPEPSSKPLLATRPKQKKK